MKRKFSKLDRLCLKMLRFWDLGDDLDWIQKAHDEGIRSEDGVIRFILNEHKSEFENNLRKFESGLLTDYLEDQAIKENWSLKRRREIGEWLIENSKENLSFIRGLHEELLEE